MDRDCKLDYIRVSAMLLIVLCHFFSDYWLFDSRILVKYWCTDIYCVECLFAKRKKIF